MNKVTVCLALALGVAFSASARPEPRRQHHEPRRPPIHRPAPRPHHKPEKVRWGVNLSPRGSSVSIGARVGKHGGISVTLPLSPPPVVHEQKTVIVHQSAPVIVQQPAPVIVHQPVVVKQSAELNPLYADQCSDSAKTWVEGYWKVNRTPDGVETARVWVPGHWE